MFKMTMNGKDFDPKRLMEDMQRQAVEAGMKILEEKVRGAAASIIDPETGKHADVFVRRTEDNRAVLSTSGSKAFARELERSLDVAEGSISTQAESPQKPLLVYLAHASEDNSSLAQPLANHLMANGIDVWFDQWEIRSGDSLRRKMEDGLDNCSHFLVVLTPVSIQKPWVQAEIDAGFVGLVGGESRFIGVRSGVGISELSPFLKTLHCPEIDLANAESVERLIADIHGVSRKPQLGFKPRYVQTIASGLERWAPSAVAVAKCLVLNSKNGVEMDPQIELGKIGQETGLPEDDVRLGILDLKDAGLINGSESINGPRWYWPKAGLFVEFDKHFADLDSKADAVGIANWLVGQKLEGIATDDLAKQFPDWSTRRLNSALNYLDEAKVVYAHTCLGTDWAFFALSVNDRTLRFVRDNS